MTKRILSSTNEVIHVNFRVYHFCYLANNGKKFTDERSVKDYMTKAKGISYKKIPDSASFVTLKLERDVRNGETVAEVCDRLKKMLAGSDAKWSILSALETDEERNARRNRDGLIPITNEVTERANATYDPLNGNEAEAGPTLDAAVVHDGKIRSKAPRKPVEAIAA